MIAVINNSSLAEGSTAESSYSISELIELDEWYGVLQLDWRELNTGKKYIIIMGVDFHVYW